MPCYHPLDAWLSPPSPITGKRQLVFGGGLSRIQREQGALVADSYEPVQVPCGKCVGCRLDHARMWSIRCVHESQMCVESMFLTLTFDDDCLIERGQNLDKRDLQLFNKRLRKFALSKLRYFACGEYGSLNGRPHYHELVFGYRFPDLEPWSSRDGVTCYRSATLESLWPYGFSLVGDVTPESCAYVARYVVKKQETEGRYVDRPKEFVLMSRRPGLGRPWIDRYSGEVYGNESGTVLVGGYPCRPPRYYDNLQLDSYPAQVASIKQRRIAFAREQCGVGCPSLASREAVAVSRLNRLKRPLDG